MTSNRQAFALLCVTLIPGLGPFCSGQRLLGVTVWLWIAGIVALSSQLTALNICLQLLGLQSLCLLIAIARSNKT